MASRALANASAAPTLRDTHRWCGHLHERSTHVLLDQHPVFHARPLLPIRFVPSPVVELNRAVAYSMAFGPASGLEIADALVEEPTLAGYHLLPAVRADFLSKLGRFAEAKRELERAAGMTQNVKKREMMIRRAEGMG